MESLLTSPRSIRASYRNTSIYGTDGTNFFFYIASLPGMTYTSGVILDTSALPLPRTPVSPVRRNGMDRNPLNLGGVSLFTLNL